MVLGFRSLFSTKFLTFFICLALFGGLLSPAEASVRRKRRVVRKSTANAAELVTTASFPVSRNPLAGAFIAHGPWVSPTFADSTSSDFVDGEDLDVRRAAVEALGPYNGSIIVSDANTGRILTMVNQKLALSGGFQPCSTIKVSVALTALQEKLITPAHKLNGVDLKTALARSNNVFFANLGIRLGYDKVSHYAKLFGYGEKAGLNIPGEQAGSYPSAPPKNGGMGMLTSFGEEVLQTPLQLAALMGALANGGTLYYLQYPRSQTEATHFITKVKRNLNIKDLIPEVKPGMLGAVEFGTARRIVRTFQDEPMIAGKTGTCTNSQTHLGWFGSFNDAGPRKLVVVVLLTGGRPAVGPLAASVAGNVYKNLGQVNYFARKTLVGPAAPFALIAAPMCCTK